MVNSVKTEREISIVKRGYGKIIRGDERCRREPGFAIKVEDIILKGGKKIDSKTTYFFNDGKGNPTSKGGTPFISQGAARVSSKIFRIKRKKEKAE